MKETHIVVTCKVVNIKYSYVVLFSGIIFAKRFGGISLIPKNETKKKTKEKAMQVRFHEQKHRCQPEENHQATSQCYILPQAGSH